MTIMKHFPVEVTYSFDVCLKLAFINLYTTYKRDSFFLFPFFKGKYFFLYEMSPQAINNSNIAVAFYGKMMDIDRNWYN